MLTCLSSTPCKNKSPNSWVTYFNASKDRTQLILFGYVCGPWETLGHELTAIIAKNDARYDMKLCSKKNSTVPEIVSFCDEHHIFSPWFWYCVINGQWKRSDALTKLNIKHRKGTIRGTGCRKATYPERAEGLSKWKRSYCVSDAYFNPPFQKRGGFFVGSNSESKTN